uniref:Tripartite motif-containing protein 45 n=2 Tax=Magallana gigas TaxID=29159 RepID=K1Q039_MAGGI
MIEKVDEMNREVTKLQKSHDVKKMQTFIPEIEKHKSPSEFLQYSFPKFHGGKIDLQAYFGYVEKLQEEAKVSTVISVIDSGFPSSDRSCLIFRETSTNSVETLFRTGDWFPRGVTSTSANDILLCLSKEDQFKVVRYSSTGTVLQEIQYDSQRQPLYTDATYVTENINDDVIVTDLMKKAVIGVDRQGILKYTYSVNDVTANADFGAENLASIDVSFNHYQMHANDGLLLMMSSKEETQCQRIVVCDLCQTPVSFFCRRCGVNLCDHCIPIHLRVKSKYGHDVVDYISKDDDDTGFCDSHPQNDCSAYCKTCNVPICMLCVSIKHKSHEMSELSDKIEEFFKLIANENDRLQSIKQELKIVLDHTTKLLSSIYTIYKQKKDEVTARGEEWHKQIEKTVKKLHQELDGMQKEHEALLKKQETEFKEIIEKLDEINRKATNLQKSHDVKKLQTFMPLIEKREALTEFTQYSFPTFYECKIDKNYLQTYFGYVEKREEKKISILGKKLKKDHLSDRRIIKVPIVKFVIDTGFPADDKNTNRLLAMAVTDDDKVWMGGHTKELKLFDLQGNLRHAVNISWKGYYLSMYSKQVVYCDYETVKKISHDNIVLTMFTTGDWNARGITSTASGDLLVCLRKGYQSKVVRYSSTGTVLQEIQYDSQCQPLYTDPIYIAENVNGDIIVTDWGKNAVVAVDRIGILRYSYSGKDRNFDVCSVATDSVGHVIVTDCKGDKIHMLDRDGVFLRYIIPEEKINRPSAVCILGTGEMMVGECLTGIAKRIKYLEE